MKAARTLLSAMALLMTVAAAQAEPQSNASTGTSFGGSAFSAAPLVPRQPTPLVTFGNFAVGIWAPVQPPYDVAANRTLAGNPL